MKPQLSAPKLFPRREYKGLCPRVENWVDNFWSGGPLSPSFLRLSLEQDFSSLRAAVVVWTGMCLKWSQGACTTATTDKGHYLTSLVVSRHSSPLSENSKPQFTQLRWDFGQG